MIHKQTSHPTAALLDANDPTPGDLSAPPVSLLTCPHCPFTASLNRKLKTHIKRIHEVQHTSPSKNHACDLCERRFISYSVLSNHIKATHMTRIPKVAIVSLKQFKCQKCVFTSTHPKTLSAHITKKHGAPDKGTVTFPCELCPFTASLSIQLRKHIAVKHAKFRCDQCNFTSTSGFHLSLHQEHIHNKTQSQNRILYPCDLCGITFVNKDDIDAHIVRRHGLTEINPPDYPNIAPYHEIAMVLESQIEMTQDIKEIKDSVQAQLKTSGTTERNLEKPSTNLLLGMHF